VLLLVLSVLLLALGVYAGRRRTGRRRLDDDVRSRGATLLLPSFLRDYWDWVTGPVVRALVRWRVSPDLITWCSLVIAGCASVSLARGSLGLGGGLYLLAGAMDLFDGRVARATGRATRAGAFIDSTIDRYAEILVLSGLAWWLRGSPLLWAALAGLSGSLMVSYTRARGEGLGFVVREGGLQRAERVVSLGGACVAAELWPLWRDPAVIPDAPRVLVGAGLVVLAVGSHVTAIQRARRVVQVLRARDAAESSAEVLRHPSLDSRGVSRRGTP